ncbi:hypothetical protein K474DRAFT_1660482 [Panus rudis PR-1116 ss-1]|nr:hypothetical protein K474DRAFT_1660482 [Panus rudis PR-1116 ss-1]
MDSFSTFIASDGFEHCVAAVCSDPSDVADVLALPLDMEHISNTQSYGYCVIA